MVVLDTTAPTELLIRQATGPANDHFIYKQYLERKKKSKLRVPDRRKVSTGHVHTIPRSQVQEEGPCRNKQSLPNYRKEGPFRQLIRIVCPFSHFFGLSPPSALCVSSWYVLCFG